MQVEELTVIFGMLFLGGGGVMMARRIIRGRQLCEQFARRLPREYLACNEPRPGFFYSARSAAYSAFVLQRQFRQLPDRRLVVQFEAMRREEMRLLMYIFGGFAVLAVAWIYIEVMGRG